jgi:hypothetical protein
MTISSKSNRDWTGPPRLRDALAGFLASVVLALAGCGNYEGGESDAQPEFSDAYSGLSQTDQVAAYASTIYPVVTMNCAGGCHDSGANGAPFLFASTDVNQAYSIIIDASKVNRRSPDQSRIVRRPTADFHECGNRCAEIGAEMLEAVEDWAALLDAAEEASYVSAIASDTVAFSSGRELENGERYTNNLIAFFDFTEGQGKTAHDTSGVQPAMDLKLVDAQWMPSYGVEMDKSQLFAYPAGSRKLYDKIAKAGFGTGQYSVEFWIQNANITQEHARIVSYTVDGSNRNFNFDQHEYLYEARNRSMAPGSEMNGSLAMTTATADQDAQEALQHIVLTYDAYRGMRIYVDSVYTGDVDPLGGERLWNWNPLAQFKLGSNRSGRNNYWRGQMRMLAIYKQTLTDKQIRMNHLAGVGRRVRLVFDVSDWIGGGTELQFAVTELDAYSYLFCQPTFVGKNLSGIRVKNIQIVVDPGSGAVPAPQGQTFANLDVTLSGTSFQVSRQCAIVPVKDGTGLDDFSVEFEELAQYANPASQTVFSYVPSPTALPLTPDSGIRDFAKVHATMMRLTGIDPTLQRAVDPATIDTIQEIYEDLIQQLPASHDARTVVSSHQIAVSKMAFEYCVELVDRPAEREAVFGSDFEIGATPFFASDVATAFANTTLADLLSERLVDHMLGLDQLSEQPLRSDVIQDLDDLRDDLVAECSSIPCDVDRTLGIAKGMCTALLASAPIMIH